MSEIVPSRGCSILSVGSLETASGNIYRPKIMDEIQLTVQILPTIKDQLGTVKIQSVEGACRDQ